MIRNLRCNQMENPIGFRYEQVSLSWIAECNTAHIQKAAQVEVAKDVAFTEVIWTTGKDASLDSLGVVFPLTLEVSTRYYWRVTVWADADNDGKVDNDNNEVSDIKVVSEVAWFETAKLSEVWQAQWIVPKNNEVEPIIRKTFSVKQPVKSARLYVSGLGLYQAFMDGVRIGEEYFTPNCNAYDKWIQYQTYELDPAKLAPNQPHVLGARLGQGWYKGRFGFLGQKGIYGGEYGFICELHLVYEDGSKEVIVSDTTFETASSHIIETDIYDGEVQDANLAIKDWLNNTLIWESAEIASYDRDYKEKLTERLSVPVLVMEQIKPLAIIQTPAGETVIDMGQNMVGWVRLSVNLPKGKVLKLQHGEVLQEGNFYNDNLRSAQAAFTYISDGTPAFVSPEFTFYGFRYVKVMGWEGELKLEDITGCVVYSQIPERGHIETSDSRINQLFSNAMWGQKGNFLDVPTDCPQRDERMGWTGDAQIFAGTALFNRDCFAFFRKYLYDMAKEQEKCGGRVPYVVPDFKMNAGGSAAWGDAATIIPWQAYLHTGDLSILTEQYDSMKGWVDFITTSNRNQPLWQSGFHFADWLALDNLDKDSPLGATEDTFIASAYYCYSATIVAKTANLLGKTVEAQVYQALAERTSSAIKQAYFTGTGRLAIETQTAQVVALYMDLVPENFKQNVVQKLVELLENNNRHLLTGFVGTPYLCPVLSENGQNDMAYHLLFNEDYPSWLYPIKMGATTIWERWNSMLPDGKVSGTGMNSFNHYAYGAIVEWMYRYMVGIQPMETSAGFRNFKLAPIPNRRLQYAKATLETTAGRIESGWSVNGYVVTYTFVVPFNTTAQVSLQAKLDSQLEINGTEIKDMASLNKLASNSSELTNTIEFVLQAGRYTISHTLPKSYYVNINTYSKLGEVLENPLAKEALIEVSPQIMSEMGGMFMFQFAGWSLRKLCKRYMLGLTTADLDTMDKIIASKTQPSN